jgi:hypothetical protein
MTPSPRRVYGVAELADRLGIPRKTAAVHHSRGKYPPPDDHLACGPVWLAETIDKWIRDRSA